MTVGLIGFGEAAQAFAPTVRRHAHTVAFDRKTDDAAAAQGQWQRYHSHDIQGAASAGEALATAKAALSLVTADQALAAAKTASSALAAGALWLDMNSVAPETKRAAQQVIERAGGRYVDVAIMAPVLPRRAAVPLLVSGADAQDGAQLLTAIGFSDVRLAGNAVGDASAIKMIRSIMVKGMEALSAECALAASAAGVLDQVIASLDASPSPERWSERFDYNLERMMAHGERRAAEMDQVATTLGTLGVDATMTLATAQHQRTLGLLRVAPPSGLGAKLDALRRLLRLDEAA